MFAVWLIALFLIKTVHGSPTSTTTSSIQEPPVAQSPSGQPYTTLLLGPTASVLTTTVQAFPTGDVFVVTALSYSTSAVNAASQPSSAGYPYSGLNQENIRVSTSYIIDLTKANGVLCWYPISGNYCRLPRILFYITIAAAVLLRSHLPWLYLGALAASLTYSGAAAIHACLLVWRGPGWGELDLYALLAILSVSCITMVPLLNWSSTIRNAGRPDPQNLFSRNREKISDDNKDFDVSSRIILIFWSLLVTVGMICAFVAFQDRSTTGRWGHWSEYVLSGAQSLSCTPESSVLNLTAGQIPITLQPDGSVIFNIFSVTQEFIDQNNCQSPCSNPIGGTALFRTEADLILLTENELLRAFEESGFGPQTREKEFIQGFATKWSFIIMYILAQGIWTACFGRYTPSQTRITLYGFFSRLRLSRRDKENVGTSQRIFSQAIALASYSWSVFIVMVAIPFLVADVAVIELYLRQIPQSETPVHIGAWSPYASTALVLFAAALAKSYEPLAKMVAQSGGNILKLLKIIRPGHRNRPTISHDAYVDAAHQAKSVLMAILEFIFGFRFHDRIFHEWNGLIQFCKDPERSLSNFRHPNRGEPVCGCPADYNCAIHPECSHHRVCVNKANCKECPACISASENHECQCQGNKDHFVTLPIRISEELESKTVTQISSINLPSSRHSTPQNDVSRTQASNLPHSHTY